MTRSEKLGETLNEAAPHWRGFVHNELRGKRERRVIGRPFGGTGFDPKRKVVPADSMSRIDVSGQELASSDQQEQIFRDGAQSGAKADRV